MDHDDDENTALAGFSGVMNLTEGTAYRAQVVTKLTLDSDTDNVTHAASAATRLPQTAMFEPLKHWFIDQTPTFNNLIGRVFMFLDINKYNGSAVCSVFSGNSINCPPRTLTSLDVPLGHHLNVTATTLLGSESSGNSQRMHPESLHLSHQQGQTPKDLRVSAGDDEMLVTWDAPAVHTQARADAYVIETRHSNDGGTNWSSWATAAVLDKSACETSYGHRAENSSTSRTSCTQLLTGLSHQMYQVRVRLRTLHDELLSGRTELNVADASGISANAVIQIGEERMLVTAITGNTLTVTRGHLSSTAAKHNSPADVLLPLLFHPGCRNCPKVFFKIDFVPFRPTDFSGPGGGQDQKPERHLGGWK